MKNESNTHNEWIPISSNDFNKEEFDRVLMSIDDRHFFNDQSQVRALEGQLKKNIETSKEVVCVSSGTAAIHLALLLAGVQRGDYVLCQNFTYIASVNPILYIGAHPVFIDSNPLDWNLDVDLLEDAIVDLYKKGIHPKALIAVNNYGMPSDVLKIKQLCEEYNIQLIEDSAESLGARFETIHTGTQADFGIFSFNNNKIFSTGGGGALVCKDAVEKQRALYYASQARTSGVDYTHEEVGYNYRLSNIQATLGLSQLSFLENNIQKRKAIHDFYQELFKTIESVHVFTEPSRKYQSNHWLSCILIDPEKSTINKEQVFQSLVQANIETRYLWKPMHLQPIFKNTMYYANGVSEELYTRGLCLPSGSNLTKNDLGRIAQAFANLFK